MGGISQLSYCSQCNEPLSCDMCMSKEHRSALCPFLYTECPKPGCEGLRKIMKSSTADNPDRLFLKCQSPKCGSFEWLDEAVDGCDAAGSSSKSPKPHQNNSCFKCGESDHWANKCPWDGSPCQEEHCTGVLHVKTSRYSSADGDFRLLKCGSCNKVTPFAEAKMDTKKHSTSSTASPKTLHEICIKLETIL